MLQGDFIQERVYLAPRGRINDLAVPHECSELVASCSHEELRLWDTRKRTELLRIHQPSLDFLCLALPKASSLCKDADVTHVRTRLLCFNAPLHGDMHLGQLHLGRHTQRPSVENDRNP